MAPLFSIITVTYNAEKTLPATLRSIAAQSCRLFEHIIIDGASNDATVSIARDAGYPVTIVSEPDSGLYDAMNKGLGLAKGDYVIFLNAGDAFTSSDTLSHIADAIIDNDYPGIVYGQTRLVDDKRQYIGPRHLTAPEVLTIDSFKEGMVVCHQAFIVLRKIVDNYDIRYRFSADYEWCIRCLQHSRRNQYLPETIIDYLSEGMTTRNRYKSLCERFAIMSRYYGLFPTLIRHFRFLKRYFKK